MIHIVQFSNGAASAWVAWWVLQRETNVILLNHDPGAEHPDSKRFQREVSEFLRHPVTQTNADKTLWELIPEQNCLPNFHMAYCTRLLKLKPAEEFYKTLTEPLTLYNGFGADEWQRVQRATVRAEQQGRVARSPLFEIGKTGEWAKEVIKNEWKICLPEPYKYLSHNNCIPCFKGGKGHFLQVARYYPEQYEKACQMEELVGHTVFKDCTLRELKAKHINEGQATLFDEETGIPCMCAG